ncbi:MAG TPA: PorP/SprF family type IX secretion system membrane protein [Bacteroidales bacterium]|nr:PorP/SprF family type IX secretion system membrane protein [Bacteroidales bacterium]
MKKSLQIIIFLLIALDSLSQDISFSHINHSRLHLNPGFAGNPKVSDITLSHRNFSPAGFGNYLTYRAAFSRHFDWANGGIALEIMRDDQGQGAISRTYIGGMYSYRIQLRQNLTIRPGLEARYAFYSLNTKDLTLPGMFERSTWELTAPHEQISGKTDQYLEFNTGFVLNYRNEYLRTYRDWTLGVAVRHLNKPSSFLRSKQAIPRKLIVYFDMEIFLKYLETYRSSTVLIPTFSYAIQKNTDRFYYGAYLKYKSVRVGAFLRHDSGLHYLIPAFQIGAAFSEFNLDYSYDAGFLNYKRSPVFSGAHEVTLSINLSIKGRNRQ